MKVTIIIGPRRCGKRTKARELARAKGKRWRECLECDGKFEMEPWDKDDGMPVAYVFPNAQRMPHEEFVRLAAGACENDADLILTTVGPAACKMLNGRPVWLDKLIASDIVELIELQPQTDAQKDFARICAIIESPTGGF